MIYVVLGMHKSGTTLVSEMLHHSGIGMVESVDAERGYDQGNKWERESTKALNHRLLGSCGAHSLRTLGGRRVPPDDRLLEQMRDTVIALSTHHEHWGFKDPRTCLTYRSWSRVLPEHRLVVVYRQPQACFARYLSSARGRWRQKLDVIVRCIPLWCEQNSSIIAAVGAGHAKVIAVDYERMMIGTEELHRLERFIERPIVDRRNPDLRRSRHAPRVAYGLAAALHAMRGGVRPTALVRALDDMRRSTLAPDPSGAGGRLLR
jgi:hypothetical protein